MEFFESKQQKMEFTEGISVKDALFARARLIDLRIKSRALYLQKLAAIFGEKGVSASDSSKNQALELKERYELYISAEQQLEFVHQLVLQFEEELGELPSILVPETME